MNITPSIMGQRFYINTVEEYGLATGIVDCSGSCNYVVWACGSSGI